MNSINLSYCSLGHLFKLLPSATLKLRSWHKCQEQKTNVSTISWEDWEGEDRQPCSRMQSDGSVGT